MVAIGGLAQVSTPAQLITLNNDNIRKSKYVAGLTADVHLAEIRSFQPIAGTFVTTGTDTYTITSSNVTTYVDGLTFDIIIGSANTSSTTLRIGALAFKPLLSPIGTPITSGQLALGSVYRVHYRSSTDEFWIANSISSFDPATKLNVGSNTMTQNFSMNGAFDYRMGNTTPLDDYYVRAVTHTWYVSDFSAVIQLSSGNAYMGGTGVQLEGSSNLNMAGYTNTTLTSNNFQFNPTSGLGQRFFEATFSSGSSKIGFFQTTPVAQALSSTPINTLLDNYGLRSLGSTVSIFSQDLRISTVGDGLEIKEGTNATLGVATLVTGTVTISTNKVTASSRIFIQRQSDSGTVSASYSITSKSAGTSFTIVGKTGTGTNNTSDTSTVAWWILEPAP